MHNNCMRIDTIMNIDTIMVKSSDSILKGIVERTKQRWLEQKLKYHYQWKII